MKLVGGTLDLAPHRGGVVRPFGPTGAEWPVGECQWSATSSFSDAVQQGLCIRANGDSEHVARASEFIEAALHPTRSAHDAVDEAAYPDLPLFRVRRAGIDRGDHWLATTEDAPRIAPRHEQVMYQFAVATSVRGFETVTHCHRCLERHPTIGVVAEVFGDQLHPSGPVRGCSPAITESAFVLEPRRQRWLQKAKPHSETTLVRHSARGLQRFGDVAIEAALPLLQMRPRHIEPNETEPKFGCKRDVVVEARAVPGEYRACGERVQMANGERVQSSLVSLLADKWG